MQAKAHDLCLLLFPGLALDLTSTHVEVPHPIIDMAPLPAL